MSVQLDIQKDKFEIGPVLPYDDHAYQRVEFRNQSDFPTEIYSLDFDSQYVKEEEYLKLFSEFTQEDKSIKKEDQKKVFAEVREPGTPFWDFITKDNEKRMKREALQKRIDSEELNDDEKAQLHREI